MNTVLTALLVAMILAACTVTLAGCVVLAMAQSKAGRFYLGQPRNRKLPEKRRATR